MLLARKNKLDLAVRNALFEPKLAVLKRVNQPIFLWTMGKVGSTSIARSLSQVRGMSVFTSHFMNEPEHPRSCALYRQLIEPKHPLKVISLVRDPISKNVSSFFQNYEKNTGRVYASNDLGLEQLSQLFFDRYQHHDSPLLWFDRYIKQYLNIDVYAKPFSTERRACTFSQGNFDLLVMRCDLSDRCKAVEIENFLGLPANTLSLVSHNVGAAKDYSETYSQFKKSVVFPQSYIQKMTASKYFSHFYTQEEIATLLKKWKTQP